MVEVRRVSGRVMTVVEGLEEDVQRLNCGCASQNGSRLEEKQSSYDDAKGEWDIHSSGDLVILLGELNEYVGRYINGFDWVLVGYGVG